MSITPLPWAPDTGTDGYKDSEKRAWERSSPLPSEPNEARKKNFSSDSSGASPADLTRRNELILEYLPLVKFIAHRIAGRLPSHIEVNDLIESGVIGLIDALEKFDRSQETQFKTYAEFRIRGAILDDLRALDWVPRSIRQKATRLEKAYAELEQKLGRTATDSEMMACLGCNAAEFDELVAEARGSALISLDELRGGGEEGFESNLLECLTDADHPSLTQNLTLEQIYRSVADTIDLMPEKERLVIALYYYEELTMKEIGEVLSVTESRVSQIHTRAILRLRGRLLKALEP